MTFAQSFKNRPVFVTGHTGFKGSWLAIWLERLGAKVTGYSLAPPTDPSNFAVSGVQDSLENHYQADVRDTAQLQSAIAASRPDVIFHLAAQTLVRQSYQEPRLSYDVNVMGTFSLLESVRNLRRPCVVIIVTSDKCYENNRLTAPHGENDPLGGYDPYSASKAAAEILIASYRHSYFPPEGVQRHGVKLASVRAGNVIGGGDWAEDRIVPDIVKSLSAGKAVAIRNPRSVRPWQHVLEPLSGYLTLASRMLASGDPELCSGWNFGPRGDWGPAVSELVEEFCQVWVGGRWRDASTETQLHEDTVLRLNIGKAMAELAWQPRWDFRRAIAKTCRWYRAFYDNPGRSTYDLCAADIAEYQAETLNENLDSIQWPPYAHAR